MFSIGASKWKRWAAQREKIAVRKATLNQKGMNILGSQTPKRVRKKPSRALRAGS